VSNASKDANASLLQRPAVLQLHRRVHHRFVVPNVWKLSHPQQLLMLILRVMIALAPVGCREDWSTLLGVETRGVGPLKPTLKPTAQQQQQQQQRPRATFTARGKDVVQALRAVSPTSSSNTRAN
jgi:hypothetical protein